MKTIKEYFKMYSNLYQFEEGSPEYLIDLEDFKIAMLEYGKAAFNAGQKTIFADLEQTELCFKYENFEECLQELENIKK